MKKSTEHRALVCSFGHTDIEGLRLAAVTSRANGYGDCALVVQEEYRDAVVTILPPEECDQEFLGEVERNLENGYIFLGQVTIPVTVPEEWLFEVWQAADSIFCQRAPYRATLASTALSW
jgi:hypothetical protein